MRDRLSSFSDPEIVNLLPTRFVAATDNDWYQRRRKDQVGEFFLSVVNQHPHPRKHHTKQGHYIFTASGKLLGFNNNRDKQNRIRFISEALTKWNQLPQSDRQPGKVKVPKLSELQLDSKYHSEPPENGVVLVASSRILKWQDEQLKSCLANDHEHPWGHLAAIDRMWFKQQEWQSLIKSADSNSPVPDRIAMRLARFHLLDFTRGEPEAWSRKAIEKLNIRLEKTFSNKYLLNGAFEIKQGERGFAGTMIGNIEVNESGQPKRFDLTVLGDHWGHGTYTKGSRPGRNPLGIAFQLADMSKPENQIRPQNSHWLQGYWQAETQF